jgi:hypothetical protein
MRAEECERELKSEGKRCGVLYEWVLASIGVGGGMGWLNGL